MIILGIDPGTRSTGYGVIHTQGSRTVCVEYGAIRPRAQATPWECHVTIYDGIAHILTQYAIEAVAVESQFFCKNARTALRLGEARSAAVLPATRAGLPVSEYAPTRVKKAIVGRGAARKEQVQLMVQSLLSLPSAVTPEDAADALAIAMCHAHAVTKDPRLS